MCECVDPDICQARQAHYQGLDVSGFRTAPSLIPDAGLGLFSTKHYKRGDIITFYSGAHVTHRPEGDRVLDPCARFSVVGEGACADVQRAPGSIVNHHVVPSARNCRYAYVPSARENPLHLVQIVATKSIQTNNEFYISYGSAYRAPFIASKSRRHLPTGSAT